MGGRRQRLRLRPAARPRERRRGPAERRPARGPRHPARRRRARHRGGRPAAPSSSAASTPPASPTLRPHQRPRRQRDLDLGDAPRSRGASAPPPRSSRSLSVERDRTWYQVATLSARYDSGHIEAHPRENNHRRRRDGRDRGRRRRRRPARDRAQRQDHRWVVNPAKSRLRLERKTFEGKKRGARFRAQGHYQEVSRVRGSGRAHSQVAGA